MAIKIEYHADDYGLFPEQSRRILDCHRQGNLNGVSIMPNSPCLDQCMQMLEPYRKDIALTVHLNLIEGRSLAFSKKRTLLTDENGIFRVSFGSLLLGSFLPGRNRLRQQLRQELQSQIRSVRELVSQQSLRLDGHAHYHMIPVVFDAMMDVIREENLDVSYIRIPREHISLYWKHRQSLTDFSPVNLVKVAVLNALALRNEHKYRSRLETCQKKVFLGVMLSGRMHRENVQPLLADAVALAEKKGWGLEILAHPGGIYEPEDIGQLTNPDDIAFLSSPMRRREATLYQPEKEVTRV